MGQLISLLLERRTSREISPKVKPHSEDFPSKYVPQWDNFSLKKIPDLGHIPVLLIMEVPPSPPEGSSHNDIFPEKGESGLDSSLVF